MYEGDTPGVMMLRGTGVFSSSPTVVVVVEEEEGGWYNWLARVAAMDWPERA